MRSGAEGSWRVPVIYIADWPDRYIHTQRDLPGNLDPTKMRRAIFIAAASGYYLATLGQRRRPARRGAVGHAGAGGRDAAPGRWRCAAGGAPTPTCFALWRHLPRSEAEVIRSYGALRPDRVERGRGCSIALTPRHRGRATPSGPVYRRIRSEGPMNGFGYSWFDDRLARAGLTRPRLLAREPDGARRELRL